MSFTLLPSEFINNILRHNPPPIPAPDWEKEWPTIQVEWSGNRDTTCCPPHLWVQQALCAGVQPVRTWHPPTPPSAHISPPRTLGQSRSSPQNGRSVKRVISCITVSLSSVRFVQKCDCGETDPISPSSLGKARGKMTTVGNIWIVYNRQEYKLSICKELPKINEKKQKTLKKYWWLSNHRKMLNLSDDWVCAYLNEILIPPKELLEMKIIGHAQVWQGLIENKPPTSCSREV